MSVWVRVMCALVRVVGQEHPQSCARTVMVAGMCAVAGYLDCRNPVEPAGLKVGRFHIRALTAGGEDDEDAVRPFGYLCHWVHLPDSDCGLMGRDMKDTLVVNLVIYILNSKVNPIPRSNGVGLICHVVS